MASTPRGMRSAIERVIRADTCSGCGGCTLLQEGLTMRLNSQGFLRPDVEAVPLEAWPMDDTGVGLFHSVCPGVTVRRPRDKRAGGRSDPFFGTYIHAWVGWSTNPATRYSASSGGVLTEIGRYLAETQGRALLHVIEDAQDPRKSCGVAASQPNEVASGSRYGPGTSLPLLGTVGDTPFTFLAKPCEVSAARALGKRIPDGTPLISFFCAGVPSQRATDAILEEAGIGLDEPASVRYRGNGWPGRFSARSQSGVEVNLSYSDSWGGTLGRNLQTRCKLCADGVGEAADVVAADYWEVDSEGFPIFEDLDGRSLLIARTSRGVDLILAAEEAGRLKLASVDLHGLRAMQAYQVHRRRVSFGRNLGHRLTAGTAVRYPGYGLIRHAIVAPGANARAVLGAVRRRLRSR